MSDVPQTLDCTPPEVLSNPDPSMRVPRKAVGESSEDFEIIASNQTNTASGELVPPQSVSNVSALNSMPIFNGISFPPNIDANLILNSDRALSMLQQLDPKRVQAALDEFAEAMTNKGERVRSAQAYFIGVVRRYVSAAEKDTPSHSNNHYKGATMGKELSPAVKNRIEHLISSGYCKREELDKIIDKMKYLSEHDSIQSCNEMQAVPRETIRNFQNYFMGIINRYMRAQEAKLRGPRENDRELRNRSQGNDQRSRNSRRDDRLRKGRSRSRSPSDRRRRSRSDSDSSDGRHRRRDRRRRDRYEDENSDDSSYSSYDRDNRKRKDRSKSRSRSRSRERHSSRSDRDKKDKGRSSQRDRSRSPDNRRDREKSRESRRSSRRERDDHKDRDEGISKTNNLPYGNVVPGLPIPPPPSRYGNIQQPLFPPVSNPHIGAPHPAFQQPHYGGSQQAQMFGSGHQYPLQSSGSFPPADIFNLAEKAAQALASTQTRGHQSSYQSNQPSNNYGSSNGDSVRDLPAMVQLSLQNLQATGHLDKELGANSCRMLKSVPENIALQVLEKFSACDVHTMRSKEGYLLGILRKAMDKKPF